ncbi:helicase [ANME-1 cluster archaeon GoMg4]|nr:helicase [ANME-1 cluster archaeon GoMg4]
MPTQDIIDNREGILLETVKGLLRDSVSAKFAVGYLFTSGLTPLMDEVQNLNELKLLIGNISSRRTIEQLAEAHMNLVTAKQEFNKQLFMNPSKRKLAVSETKGGIRTSLSLIDQTDDNEQMIRVLRELIEKNKIKIRIYTLGRLHSKAYIFDYPEDRRDKGNAIIGSSNLSLAGLSDNTELNALVPGNDNHEKLTEWFDELWEKSDSFRKELMEELKNSWALNEVRPYDVYIKTLYHLLKDRLEIEAAEELLWEATMPPLTTFQIVAVKQALQILNDYGGVFVADVVGTGKTYIGTALLKHLQMVHGDRPLIICPKSLTDTWEDFCREYGIQAEILTLGMISQGTIDLINDPKYRNLSTVLIDESHNLRYPNTNRYKNLQPYLYGKKTILVTATPRNNSPMDIYHQIKLFHHDEETMIPIEPSNLKRFFKEVETGNKRIQELLRYILIRRTRRHILKWYGEEDKHGRLFIRIKGEPYYFPKRELETWTYSIDDTYSGFYDDIMDNIQALTFAKYGLWNYLHDDFKSKKPYNELAQIGKNLRGLMKVLVLKRLESSIFAFRRTIGKLLEIHERFFKSLEKGFIPAGEEASELLYDAESYDEEMLLENLERLSGRYDPRAFKIDELKRDIENDQRILKEILDTVGEIDPETDDKLKTLKDVLSKPPVNTEKVLIFTQYADTAEYLYQNLKDSDVRRITSKEKNRMSVIRRFAPKSNNYELREGEQEIRILVSTDILSEGLNLQDAFIVINYDLHWNPVRLIQRIGRLDRIGALADTVYVHNFLPEKKLEKHLHLKERIQSRIDEIHRTIGEDERILDKTEQINEEAMYAIYEKMSYKLEDFEVSSDPLSEDLFGMNEAEELLREIRENEPEYFEYIKNLPDGIRAAKSSNEPANFTFCQAGDYQKIFLTDKNSNLIKTDIITALNRIKCDRNENPVRLPDGFNKSVTKVMKRFRRDIGERITRQDAMKTLKPQQRYVLNKLQRYYEVVDSPEIKSEIDSLKEVFGFPLSNIILQHLGKLRRGGIEGKPLFDRLKEIYFQYGLHRLKEQEEKELSPYDVPKIVCSMAMVKRDR